MNKILLSPALLIYNASAGSGKTTTLLREILQLAFSEETINNEQKYKNIKIRNILGLTFTNAVAAELKSRLFDILSHTIKKDTVYYEKIKKAYFANESSELTDNEITEKANQLLRYLLHHYSDLSLMTIDSFSNRLLRSFAYELKHPFVYNIATNKDDYYEKTLDYFLDTIDNEKIQWYLKYILSKKYEDDEKYNINKLNNEILKIFKALDEKEIPGEYLLKLQQNLKNINENQLHEKLKQIRNAITKKISELNDEIRTIIKTTGEKYGYFFINNDNEPEQFENSLINGNRFKTIISIYKSENVYENLLKSYFEEKWKSEFFKKNIKDKNIHEKKSEK